ncbi:superoxide dismutase [Neoehrlichia mikurensis]|uniref:Superoxide dismutase n=1 Tax=Neoehrlichia mikurensis TaxID=89586 RepID=A0A9Q9BV45_9RICK|nr:superoxide dismutase [Neoehrlichia mikurensis]QXK91858.1 superoxide dismutase [Neoehrlichia mikurensis]QXK93071.1 superoxide dismutase [Neoehrlichia mikurensis]QXK93551.1 superoxide dismutase [Neoehrlichia mikurensis]UTO55493.1 superoxide dismutase [Neoehrlichia mikurensis]UTO56415.1 superoxide dismutase [Neoehrlichia mikurensis]
MFNLMPLPYDNLEPYISAKILDYHYNKHHKGYVNNLNKLVQGTEFQDLSNVDLENIIKRSYNNGAKAIFNNAGQVWNHDFYWQSMKKNGGGNPEGQLADKISADFGSIEEFINIFSASGQSQFGSGWTWLIYDISDDKLKVISTSNADSPLLYDNQYPLITMDVWEHAYYLDYFNVRANYIEVFLKNLVNWEFALQRLQNYPSK